MSALRNRFEEVERPNGKVYRPLKDAEAVLLGYEEEDPHHVLVMRTHDVHGSLTVAEAAVEEYVNEWYGIESGVSWTVTEPEQVWKRVMPGGTAEDGYSMRLTYRDDPVRGAAAVRWKVEISEAAAA